MYQHQDAATVRALVVNSHQVRRAVDLAGGAVEPAVTPKHIPQMLAWDVTAVIAAPDGYELTLRFRAYSDTAPDAVMANPDLPLCRLWLPSAQRGTFHQTMDAVADRLRELRRSDAAEVRSLIVGLEVPGGRITLEDCDQVTGLMARPSAAGWTRAAGIVLDRTGTRLLDAVRVFDLGYPDRPDTGGRWSRVPDAVTLYAALCFGTGLVDSAATAWEIARMRTWHQHRKSS
ncbi:hypothetical protein AB0M43_23920 [Longispora sp. NPDC051575]|uniref:hypothetical protein n=1 Tax=Longispora sp. NPDC051575 TaxID=3154943 RepID=UPI003412054B